MLAEKHEIIKSNQNPKSYRSRTKEITLKAEITTDIKAFSINEDGSTGRLYSDSATEKDILANSGYICIAYPCTTFIFQDSKLAGFAGARKFFLKQSNGKGIRIYQQPKHDPKTMLSGHFQHTRQEAETDYKISTTLSRSTLLHKPLHPESELIEINLNLQVKSLANNELSVIKNKTWGLITDEIHTPLFLFNTNIPSHKEWIPRFLSNRKQQIFDMPLTEFFPEEFFVKNPKFNKRYWTRTQKRVNRIFHSDHLFRSLRKGGKNKPDTKYTNILYCTKRKSFFWVDFD